MRAVISILLLGLVSCQAIAGEITGSARIIDGDTIEIRKGGREETVRLHGIDRCGIHARKILAALVEDRVPGRGVAGERPVDVRHGPG